METAILAESRVTSWVFILPCHTPGPYLCSLYQLIWRQDREATETPANDVSAHDEGFVAAVSRNAAYVSDQPSLVVAFGSESVHSFHLLFEPSTLPDLLQKPAFRVSDLLTSVPDESGHFKSQVHYAQATVHI